MSNNAPVILVVDDNPASLYATTRVLRGADLNVLEATTGAEALRTAASGVDLVVLDVNLPDVDGFEVCRRLRANEATSRTPVIHLSATFVKDADKLQGFDAGADGYLTHPIEPPVLIATINAFLRARRAEKEREELLHRERAARAEAERANRLKDEFLATVSHELRSPLSAIVGWSQLLRQVNLDSSEAAEGLEAIERNARIQTQMIDDLLDVSRITSGKMRLNLETVDPVAIVDMALATAMPAAEAKNLRIVMRPAPPVGLTQADPDRLQQVVWNLLNNAIKFTPPGGLIQVALEQADSRVRISVADNGAGIRADVLPIIFERFRQGDGTMTRHHGGLGLGLAIAKQLVEMHGGTISVASAGENAGATFVVELPLSSVTPGAGGSQPESYPTAPRPLVAGADAAIRLDGIRVLIVNDNPDARYLTRRTVADRGAVALDVESAALGISAIASFRPQVIISDLGMPGQDGLEMIREIRARGYSAGELPAIALTAFARNEDRQIALQAGFQVHLNKPVNSHELASVIVTLVPGRQE